MRFDVEQRFLASPAQVLAVYTDPAFYADLPEYPKVGRPRLVDRDDQGDRIVVRVHYRFTADLPSAALAVRVSSASGPSNIRVDSFCARAASTSSKTARAAGKASARALPMPTACEMRRNSRLSAVR